MYVRGWCVLCAIPLMHKYKHVQQTLFRIHSCTNGPSSMFTLCCLCIVLGLSLYCPCTVLEGIVFVLSFYCVGRYCLCIVLLLCWKVLSLYCPSIVLESIIIVIYWKAVFWTVLEGITLVLSLYSIWRHCLSFAFGMYWKVVFCIYWKVLPLICIELSVSIIHTIVSDSSEK